MADKKISQLTAATTPLAGTEVLPIVQSGSTVKVATDDLTVKNVRSNATTGILQIAGPGAGTTRVMTTPNANFTAARTDAAQTFTGSNTFSATAGVVATFKSDAAADFRPIFFTNSANSILGGLGVDHTASYFALKAYGTDLFFGAGADGLKEARLTSSGNFTLANGNFVPSTAGKGIDFSANTHAAGMTSELLNWYEEGTWTPTANNLTVVGDPTYTGRYTRVGRVVYIELRIASTTTTASTAGSTFFGGLPFTPANGSTMTFANANATDSYGTNLLWTDGRVYCPTWAATATVIASGFYFV